MRSVNEVLQWGLAQHIFSWMNSRGSLAQCKECEQGRRAARGSTRGLCVAQLPAAAALSSQASLRLSALSSNREAAF